MASSTIFLHSSPPTFLSNFQVHSCRTIISYSKLTIPLIFSQNVVYFTVNRSHLSNKLTHWVLHICNLNKTKSTRKWKSWNSLKPIKATLVETSSFPIFQPPKIDESPSEVISNLLYETTGFICWRIWIPLRLSTSLMGFALTFKLLLNPILSPLLMVNDKHFLVKSWLTNGNFDGNH